MQVLISQVLISQVLISQVFLQIKLIIKCVYAILKFRNFDYIMRPFELRLRNLIHKYIIIFNVDKLKSS